jgi:NhaP-type Na+/H+ or K+/H+ antiporter
MAFVLGAVLASTDPVAVSALGRRLSLPPRIQALVQAESLFNDATSLVLFQIAVSLAVAGGAAGNTAAGTLLQGAGRFAILAGGGAAAGSVIAADAIACAGASPIRCWRPSWPSSPRTRRMRPARPCTPRR